MPVSASSARRLARPLAFACGVLVLAAASAAPKAHVGDFKDSTVSVIDTGSNAVITTVPVAAAPHGTAVPPDGRFAWVAGEGSTHVSVTETASDGGAAPHRLSMLADGKTAWRTNEGSNDLSVDDLARGSPRAIAIDSAPGKVVVQAAAAGGSAAAAAAVSIANFAFAPAKLAVVPGTTVTWRNDDGAPHAIAFSDGTAPSDLLLPGQGFARTFATAGTFAYHCSVHPSMKGMVTVRN